MLIKEDIVCFICETMVPNAFQFRKSNRKLNLCLECFKRETTIDGSRKFSEAIGKCYVCLYKLSSDELREEHIRLGMVRLFAEPKRTAIICDKCYDQHIGVPLMRPITEGSEDQYDYLFYTP